MTNTPDGAREPADGHGLIGILKIHPYGRWIRAERLGIGHYRNLETGEEIQIGDALPTIWFRAGSNDRYQEIIDHFQPRCRRTPTYIDQVRCDICGAMIKCQFSYADDKWHYIKDPKRCQGACEPTGLRIPEPLPLNPLQQLTVEQATEALRFGMRAVYFSEDWTGRRERPSGDPPG